MAVLLTQPEYNPSEHTSDTPNTISRMSKTDMVNPIDYSIPTEHYRRQKKPEMPKEKSLKSVLPLKVLAHGVLAAKRARETDFAFLQDVLISEDCFK